MGIYKRNKIYYFPHHHPIAVSRNPLAGTLNYEQQHRRMFPILEGAGRRGELGCVAASQSSYDVFALCQRGYPVGVKIISSNDTRGGGERGLLLLLQCVHGGTHYNTVKLNAPYHQHHPHPTDRPTDGPFLNNNHPPKGSTRKIVYISVQCPTTAIPF